MQNIKKDQNDTVKQLKELAPKPEGGADAPKTDAATQTAMDVF